MTGRWMSLEGLELAVTVDPEDGEIVDVGPFRHRVRWRDPDGRTHLSHISYCNGCGSPFVRRAITDEVGGENVKRAFMICGSCGEFQGWCDELHELTRPPGTTAQ